MANAKILRGKWALVTGGSSGMGKASARILAQQGANVVIMGRREEILQSALKELRAQAPDVQVEMFVGDATDEDSAKSALHKVSSFDGRLDIIVSAVGKGVYKPVLMLEAADMFDEYRAEVMTAFYMIRHGVPLMQRGGSIVCVSSTAGKLPCAGLAPYAAAKAALEMFVKVAAVEMGPAGIRINAVRPGFTRSEGTAAMFEDAETLRSFTDFIPMGRGGESDDLARAIRFLAGPESAWVTGQVLAADGGQELKGFPDPNPLLDMIYGEEVMKQVRRGQPPK